MSVQPSNRFAFTARQVNVILEILFVVLILSGLGSWLLALDNAWIAATIHSIAGFMLVLMVPLKLRGSVMTGFKRGRLTRWLSTIFGLMLLSGIVLGWLHTTAIWWGIGYWSAMWTHLLLGFTGIPLFLWHTATRPSKPKLVDLDRRALLSAAGLAGAGAVVYGTQEVVLAATDQKRAGTGSHEIASFEPEKMPRMQWINDTAPRVDLDTWDLRIEGESVEIDALAEQTERMVAWLDCTDGWRSQQRWDVVPLDRLLSDRPGRSVKVTSATGYSRLFDRSDAKNVYLCFGYDGKPLQRGHGAPVRLVAPNRRGPWWIKWVVDIELTDRRAWLQLPFPAT